MIVVLFGQPGSGKTTLAKEFKDFINIDGDKLRNIFSNKDYSKEGRIKNLNRASDIAVFMNKEGFNVVLSLIYPYKETRDYLNRLNSDIKWIYLIYDDIRGREEFHVKDFEEPKKCLYLNTSSYSIDECMETIKSYIG